MTKTLYKTAKHTGFRNTRPQFYTHWNAQQAQTIQRNVLNAVSGLDFGVEYMPLLKAYTEAHRTQPLRRQAMKHTWRLSMSSKPSNSPAKMQACGWEVSKDARGKAKEAREAYYKTTYRQAWRNKPSKTMQEYNKNRRCRRLASR
ncbi:MAG: hypothetical protein CM15mV29_0500 [uncultured marine virus]|nr:MAG: hypothetical protein CM15mV29_0500 [uncultured marine virus]